MQIGSLIRRAALHHGDAPCLVEGERVVSFREFDALTDRVGHALRGRGLVPGDRVVRDSIAVREATATGEPERSP